MLDDEREGWRGFRINQFDKKARKSTERLSPNIFLVNASPNYCFQAFETARAGEHMSQMLNFLCQVCLRSVFLSALVVSANKGVDILVRELDDQFRVPVEKKAT
jgi:hypothetical protein